MRGLVLGWVVVGVWACRDVLRVREERAGDLAQKLADESPAIHAAFHSACPGHAPGHRPVCLRVLVSGGPPGYRVFAQACEAAFHAAAAASRRFRLLFPLNHLPSCQGQDLKRHKRHGDQSYYAICLFKRGRRARRRKRESSAQEQTKPDGYKLFSKMRGLMIACGVPTALFGLLVLGLMYLATRSQTAITWLWKEIELPIRVENLTMLLSKHKMPDTLVLDWADNVDLPPTFWDDWNLTYAEFARCPPAAVTAMDFWDWGSTLATPPTPMETKADESPLFNLALLIPHPKLIAMGLDDMAEWRITEDPQYDTCFIDDAAASHLLPTDGGGALTSRRGKLGSGSSFLLHRFVAPKKLKTQQSSGPLKGKEMVAGKEASRRQVMEAVSGMLHLEEKDESVMKVTARDRKPSDTVRQEPARSDSQMKEAVEARRPSTATLNRRVSSFARPSDVTLDSENGTSASPSRPSGESTTPSGTNSPRPEPSFRSVRTPFDV